MFPIQVVKKFQHGIHKVRLHPYRLNEREILIQINIVQIKTMWKNRSLIGCLAFTYFALFCSEAFAQTTFSSYVQGTLETGDRVMRSDGSLYDTYTFEGNAGQQVTINLYSSDFDPYLILNAPEGKKVGENDDRSQDNRDSELIMTLPITGTYTVVANSYTQGNGGNYQLMLRSTNVSTAISNSGDIGASQACTSAIAGAVRRLEEVKDVNVVEVSTNDSPRGYVDYPANRPISYSFSLNGNGTRTVLASPQFEESLVLDIIKNCNTVSMVSIGWHATDGAEIFGLFGTNQIEKFACVEINREGGNPHHRWGESACL
jgi:Bacterial pre-peptidase C-terminal domain